MLGDTSLARVPLCQQARRVPVRLGAVGCRNLPVDAGAQDGVGEGERPLLQHPGADQKLGRLRRRARCEPGQGRCLGRLGALQDRHGASEARRVGAQPSELQHRPSPDGCDGEPPHPRRRGVDRSDPGLDERRDERANQERRSTGRVPARQREAGLGLGAQPHRDQPGDPVGGERRQREDLGRRVHRQHGEQLPLAGSRLGGPRRHHDGSAQLLQSWQEEREEPQRRTVRPLRVVHHQSHRALGRQVREQPVEPVEHREGRVRSDRRRLADRAVGVWQAEEPDRDPGWSLQE